VKHLEEVRPIHVKGRGVIPALLFLTFSSLFSIFAQDTNHDSTTESTPSAPVTTDKRAFGVIPNYKTVEESSNWQAITPKRKLWIAYKDSVDWPIFFVSGIYAGFGQAANTNPSFGQGMEGYAKRYGGLYADLALGNVFAEGLMPIAFHEDPRYFRRGTGKFSSRLGYAATRIFVTRTDGGTRRFNFSESVGNALAVGVSNAYYPDGRSVEDNLNRFAFSLGTDALGNVLKEFWPDVKRKLTKH
jgi:hypothetical protein